MDNFGNILDAKLYVNEKISAKSISILNMLILKKQIKLVFGYTTEDKII